MSGMRNRRDFLRVAGATTAGGSAALLAACGDDDGGQGGGRGTNTESDRSDAAVLNAALDLEHLAVAAYTAGAGLLRGEARELGRQLLAHEREHVAGLTRAISNLGGTPSEAKPAEGYAPMLAGLRDQEDVLRFALDLSNTAVAAYIAALPRLASPSLRQTAVAIMSSEAQHISVLLGLLGEPQVPEAFVTGGQA